MYVAAEDDDGEDRELWRCFECPRHDTCKKSRSFKNACCYSYISEEECREYVKRHLLRSGVHRDDGLTEDTANELAQSAEIVLEYETEPQRKEYRESVSSRPQEPDWPPPGRKRQGDDAEEPPSRRPAIGAPPPPILQPVSKAGGAAVAPLVEALAHVLANAAAGSSGSSGLAASNTAALATRAHTPTSQGVELVTDSMNRILESIGQATSQCISTARTLNEEGQRLRAAASAIEQAMRR